MIKVEYERFNMPLHVIASLPVTDAKAAIESINRYRYICAAERVAKRKRSLYQSEYMRKRRQKEDEE